MIRRSQINSSHLLGFLINSTLTEKVFVVYLGRHQERHFLNE